MRILVNKKLLTLNNISKKYGSKWVLKQINLDINKNERIAIIGKNGSGKTTLIQLIANIVNQNKGHIKYYFKEAKLDYAIGFQMTSTKWPQGMLMKDIIKLYTSIYRSSNLQWINQLIDVLELRPLLNTYLDTLTAAERQLFSIFLTLFHQPELLIFDEISSYLGFEIKTSITLFLKNLAIKNKKTIIIVSNAPDQIESLCDRIIHIENGVIINDILTSFAIEKYGSIINYMQKKVS